MNVPAYIEDDTKFKRGPWDYEESKVIKSVSGYENQNNNVVNEEKSLSGDESISDPDIEESKFFQKGPKPVYKNFDFKTRNLIGLPENFHKELIKIYCGKFENKITIILSTTDSQTDDIIYKPWLLSKDISDQLTLKDWKLNLYEIDWNLLQNRTYKVYIPKIFN